MVIPFPKDAVAKLPSPDEQGMVRVQATLKISSDGEVDLQDLNGTPVGSGGNDDAAPMPSQDLPNLDQATSGFTGGAPAY